MRHAPPHAKTRTAHDVRLSNCCCPGVAGVMVPGRPRGVSVTTSPTRSPCDTGLKIWSHLHVFLRVDNMETIAIQIHVLEGRISEKLIEQWKWLALPLVNCWTDTRHKHFIKLRFFLRGEVSHTPKTRSSSRAARSKRPLYLLRVTLLVTRVNLTHLIRKSQAARRWWN